MEILRHVQQLQRELQQRRTACCHCHFNKVGVKRQQEPHVHARTTAECLTEKGGRLRAFLQALHRRLRVLPSRNNHGFAGSVNDRRLDAVGSRGGLVHLLVLDEGEPDVHGADVEEDGDGDVEETEQHHQLTGPVEEAEVDRAVCGHPGAANPEEEPSVRR